MINIKNVLLILVLIWTHFSCGSKDGKAEFSIKDINDLKTRQYAVNGKILYDKLCANCHQEDGTGLLRLIPPLAGADYMNEDIARTIRIIKFGLKEEILVNGDHYNQPMPSNQQLTDLEISEIATYIYNVWGNNEGLISPKMVRLHLEK